MAENCTEEKVWISWEEAVRQEYNENPLPFLIHDFNNYLHIVSTNVVLARQQVAAGPIAERLTAVEAGLHLIKLLAQQFWGREQREEIPQAISILTLVHAVTPFILHRSGTAYEIICIPAPWPVQFPSNFLLRILTNILTNAVEAMPHGGKIILTIDNALLPAGEVRQNRRYVKVSIEDRGIGIPAHLLPEIFTPGFSTKGKGRGLGLASCRTMLEKNGGKLEVASTAGDGSIFTLYLPAGEPPV